MVTVSISIPLFACQDASLHRSNLENEQGYPYEYMGMVNTARKHLREGEYQAARNILSPVVDSAPYGEFSREEAWITFAEASLQLGDVRSGKTHLVNYLIALQIHMGGIPCYSGVDEMTVQTNSPDIDIPDMVFKEMCQDKLLDYYGKHHSLEMLKVFEVKRQAALQLAKDFNVELE